MEAFGDLGVVLTRWSGEPAYALPPGPVHTQVYEDSLTPASVIAEDLPGILAIVRRALERSGSNGSTW